MESLFFLIPLSIVLLGIAAFVFVRAVDRGQFEELDQHGMDILDSTEVNNDHDRP